MRLYLLLLLCFPFMLSAQTPCHPDFDALMALYNSTDGANWTNNTGWVDGAAGTDCDVCAWYGVYCSAGRIQGIQIIDNNLNGSLPPEIGNLSELFILSIQEHNLLGGSLPPELGNLTHLKVLALGSNDFTGSIPIEIGNLDLLIIWLQQNQLSGSIPVELGNVSSLGTLILSKNQLNGSIPAELGNLNGLTQLFLDDNQFSGTIPDVWWSFGSIKEFSVANNLLTGPIPTSLGYLTQIEKLYLNDNQLSGCIPANMSELCTVYQVDISNNLSLPSGGDFVDFCVNGTGGCAVSSSSCHPDFDALLDLYHATNGANWFYNTGWIGGAAGTDCDVCNWYGVTCDASFRVTELWLFYNNLTGGLPASLGTLSSLEQLILPGNTLVGQIPSTIGGLSNLVTLDLRANKLGSAIPTSIGLLTNLQELNLSYNLLEKPIPPALGNLTNLDILRLENNRLTGGIPASLGNLTNLNTLLLHNNFFQGCFPDELMVLCGTVPTINMHSHPVGDFSGFCSTGVGDCDIALQLKVFLGGPYDNSTGLMNDDLRALGLIPSTNAGMNAPHNFDYLTGNDAIVDWVTIELRSVTTPSVVSAERLVLVQRDGDLVDQFNVSPIYFDNLSPGDYHVAIRHRNHLGVMSSTTVTVY